MSTKELTITPALRAAIAETVHEVLSDPDLGLELQPAIKKRLKAAENKKQRWTPLEEVRRKYL